MMFSDVTTVVCFCLNFINIMLQGVLKKFLMDKIPLHVTAIYALQVFAYNNGSPKGKCSLIAIATVCVLKYRIFISA